jgi:hypothetical protein
VGRVGGQSFGEGAVGATEEGLEKQDTAALHSVLSTG